MILQRSETRFTLDTALQSIRMLPQHVLYLGARSVLQERSTIDSYLSSNDYNCRQREYPGRTRDCRGWPGTQQDQGCSHHQLHAGRTASCALSGTDGASDAFKYGATDLNWKEQQRSGQTLRKTGWASCQVPLSLTLSATGSRKAPNSDMTFICRRQRQPFVSWFNLCGPFRALCDVAAPLKKLQDLHHYHHESSSRA